MPREGNNLLDFLYLLDAVWDLDYLQGELVEVVFYFVVVEADVDLAVGALAEHELFGFGVMVAEELLGVLVGDALAVDYFVMGTVYYLLEGLDLALAMLEDAYE